MLANSWPGEEMVNSSVAVVMNLTLNPAHATGATYRRVIHNGG